MPRGRRQILSVCCGFRHHRRFGRDRHHCRFLYGTTFGLVSYWCVSSLDPAVSVESSLPGNVPRPLLDWRRIDLVFHAYSIFGLRVQGK